MTGLVDTTLQSVCTLVTDGTHDTPKVLSEGIPFIKAKQITNGIIDFDDCEFISYEDHLKVISRSKPEKGDTLFAHIGATLGATAYVNTNMEFSIKNVALFKPNPNIIDPRYLYYLVTNDGFQRSIKNYRTGAAQPFVSLDILRNQPIKYHIEIETQRKIAAILSAYDDLIENNTRRIHILEEMAQTLYRHWFVDYKFPGHEAVRLVDSGTELGKVPDGFETVTLEDALVLQRGFDLPVQDRQDGNIPVFAATGITGTHNTAKVKAPGVVTGRSGSLGTVIYVDDDFWPLNTTLWVKEYRRVTPLFAYYLLKGMGLAQYNSGAAVPTLNRNDIHGLPIIIPPKQLLENFDNLILPIYALKKNFHNKNVNLHTTRDLLLPKLVSGELDVSELEIAGA